MARHEARLPELAEAPSEWRPLCEALSRCDRANPPPGALVDLLLRALDVHRAMEAASDSRVAAPDECAAAASELLPRAGGPLRPPDALLYERVAAATTRAHGRATVALEASSSQSLEVAADESATLEGPPTSRELEGGASRRAQAVRPTAFRDAYMELLADGAADELDSLRREEPPMDEAGLKNLVEALEAGSEAFSRAQRPLLAASFHGSASWWARRGESGGRSSASDAARDAVSDEKGLEAAPAPLLVSRVAELEGRRQRQRTV